MQLEHRPPVRVRVGLTRDGNVHGRAFPQHIGQGLQSGHGFRAGRGNTGGELQMAQVRGAFGDQAAQQAEGRSHGLEDEPQKRLGHDAADAEFRIVQIAPHGQGDDDVAGHVAQQ